MNKIYKVIWSKAKHTYVVASEIAKGHTKGETTGRGLKKLAAAMLVAAALLSPSFAWAEGTVTVTDPTTSKTVEVYTKEGAEKEISILSTQIGTNATNIDTNTKNINGLTTRVNALESSKTDTALHISSSGDLIVGTKENQTVKDMEIRGELTSGSISTGDITSSRDVTVTGKMAAGGVTDETTKDGTYIKQNNTVGNNLVSLDKQVKANADAINTEATARESKDNELNDRITNVKEYLEKQTSDNYVSKADAAVQDGAIVKAANTIGENVTNLDAALAKETAARIGADKAQDAVIQQVNQNAANGIATLVTAYNNEVASREAADNELNERITNEANAIHKTTNQLQSDLNTETAAREAGDKTLDDRITAVKDYVLKETGDNYVSKADAAVQDAGVVKADKKIGENVTALGKGLYDETAARIGADAAQDKVIQQVNDNLVQSVTTINKNVADGFTALNQADAKEAAAREAKDNELNERITNEANAIHDEIKAGDEKLDTRITNVKEYLENQTVSKTDAAVQDGAIVKAAKTIGENVTNLDAALAKETAARIGADKAQDEVIKQVNQNVADGFNTINTNMANGFAALNQADANEAAAREAADAELDDKITAETSARVVADTKLVEATNGGLSLSDDNVLQKNTTTIDAQGNVTTSKTDANEIILNKGNDNQITLNEKGIKVGTNSSVMDKDGVYTGGDTYSEAKAALKSDGQIKGANGKFTVDASGNTTVTSLDTGTGTIQTKGDIYAKDATFSGDITAKDATLSGDLSAKDGTFSGDLSAKDGTFSGDVSAKDVTATGTLQGAEVTDGTATMKNGNITGVKDLSAETITTSGDATIGGDLTVKGKLNVDEIDLTKSGIVGNNNVTASTKVAAGEITGYKKATSTKDGSEKESAIDYDENGTSTWAKAIDADGNWKKSTLTVEGSDVKSKVVDSEKNSNLATQTSTQSQSTLTDKDNNTNVSTQTASESSSVVSGKDGGNNYKSYITQNRKKILQKIEDGDGHVLTSTEQTETGITNTAANGTLTNDAKALVNKASDSITSQIGDGSAVKSVMDANGIANTATGGTISNSAANISNTTTGNMTNTVGGNLIDTIMGTSTTTVTGKVTEDYKSDLSTKVGGDETHAVTGNQTTTVSGNRTVNVKGTETENFNALETNVKTDQKTSVGGNQTNIVAGNQQNTVSGNKTETVKGSVTEKYGSQATTVDGDQSTNIGGNQTTVVAKDQTNTVSGNKTETVKGAVNETYGSQSTTVNGNQSNTVKGTLTETVTGDVTEDYKANLSTKVGGNQTTTVTGDSSLSAKNINNKATKALTNEAETITNKASESVTTQIGDGSAVKSEMTADGITNTAEGGTIYNKSKDILNEVSGNILNFADGEIGNSATKITNLTGDNTVTSDTNGTTFENKAHSKAIEEGSVTKTTISGNTLETGKATMDYAEVMKDLGVHGNATVDKKLTVKGDSDLQGNATVGKDLEVKGSTKLDGTLKVVGKSTFKDDVTMEKNLDVKGTTTTDKLVVNNGATVTGGTTTDTLKVTGSSEFDGKATFNDIVTMNKGLSVTGGVTADTVTAYSYKVGDKTYIDKDGINANNQVIRNVGQGNISEGSTDAVSGGQLYETNTRVSGLETRMGTVETRVDKLDGKIDKVGANAAAMANLHPLEFDEDSKWNIAAAVGSSGSETASAVGVFYRPNENVMVNASAAMGTGENMFGGGVSLRLGHGGNKAKEAQMKAAAAENKELRAKVDDLTARMDALLSVLNPNMSKDFPDVPENHWAYEAVSRLAGNGIVEGYEDGKYHGERQMTRYEMAEIIYNALSKGAKAEKKLVEEFRPEIQAMAAQKKA